MNAKPFVSTEELLGRLAEAPRVPGFSTLRKLLAFAVAVSVPFWLGLLFFGEHEPSVSRDVRKVDDVSNASSARAGEPAEVQVIIELAHPGSIFIDGRHLAMRSRCVTHLARGRHVLLVHLAGASFRRVLDVEDQALWVTLDTLERKLVVKDDAPQTQVPSLLKKLPSRLLGKRPADSSR